MPTANRTVRIDEHIRVNTRRGLESIYSTDREILSSLLPNIQARIFDAIGTALVEHISTVCNGAVHQSESIFRTPKGVLFQFSVVSNIKYPEELWVTFFSIMGPRTRLRDVERPLSVAHGGYKKLLVIHSPGVSPNIPLILTICEAVISTFYEWAYSRVFAIGRSANENLTERLYGRLHEIYHDRTTLDNFWLGFVYRNRCYYLIDSRRRDRLLTIMSETGRKLGAEPLALACTIMEMNLSFDQSAARVAFSQHKHLRVAIEKLPYSADVPTLLIAEEIMYGSCEFAGT